MGVYRLEIHVSDGLVDYYDLGDEFELRIFQRSGADELLPVTVEGVVQDRYAHITTTAVVEDSITSTYSVRV